MLKTFVKEFLSGFLGCMLIFAAVVVLAVSCSEAEAASTTASTPDVRAVILSVLLALVCLLLVSVYCISTHSVRRIQELRNEVARLREAELSQFCKTEIKGARMRPVDDRERLVLVEFYSFAAMQEFERWINRQRRQARK